MKANELRIGNFVSLDGLSTPIKVSIIDTTETSTDTKSKPIKLTEEWLFSFGFKKHPNDIPSYVKTFGYFNDNDFEYAFFVYQDSDNNFYAQIIGKKIILNSVHQLQNLYFTIAERELIKGDKL
jgi:hypothetical protein